MMNKYFHLVLSFVSGAYRLSDLVFGSMSGDCTSVDHLLCRSFSSAEETFLNLEHDIYYQN